MLSTDHVAQLVGLPLVKTDQYQSFQTRGNLDFGSSDAFWVQWVGLEQPTLTLWINENILKVL